ncbi:MAG: TetR/AcrR family transcriptional regulator [Phycisphaerae bacterium]|nr:TetR/AcrR family transcriptional regulator [Phycisphaerae bacterium]
MPSPRFERLDPVKRDAILEAARQEFAAHGFERASCNRIIAQAGLSKGSFYYYFHSKDDLYLTVAKDAISRFSLAIGDPARIASVDEFWAECARLYRRLLEFGQKNPLLVGLFESMVELRPGEMTEELMQQLVVKDAEWYGAMILRGQALGAVRTDLPLDVLMAFLYALFQAKSRLGVRRWLEYGPEEIESNADMMIDVFRRIATPAPQTDDDLAASALERPSSHTD